MPRAANQDELIKEKIINKYVDILVNAYQKSDSKTIHKLRNYLFNDDTFKSKESTWEKIVAQALWRANYASK